MAPDIARVEVDGISVEFDLVPLARYSVMRDLFKAAKGDTQRFDSFAEAVLGEEQLDRIVSELGTMGKDDVRSVSEFVMKAFHAASEMRGAEAKN